MSVTSTPATSSSAALSAQEDPFDPWVLMEKVTQTASVGSVFNRKPARPDEVSLIEQATGFIDRLLIRTKTAVAALPSVPVSLRLSENGAGLSVPLSRDSELSIGSIHGTESRFGITNRLGVNWVTEVSDHSRFFVGMEKRTGGAEETLSGLGMLYDLE